MATALPMIETQPVKEKRGSKLAFRALLLFSFLYYARPEDVIPGMAAIPVGKIVGGIALIGLIAGLLGKKAKTKFPLELKLLLLLFAHLILTIPFAFWRMGALSTVFDKFSKGVIVALLVALVVQTVDELRKLLWVQAAAVAFMVLLTDLVHPAQGGRMGGLLGGIFENPNDLAINIAINWPLCLAFLFAARGALRKGLWGLGLLAMLYAVVATYSRSGSIALLVSLTVCVWEFAIRGKRLHLLIVAGILAIGGASVMVATPHYLTRMKSIVQGDIQGAGDRGSWEARRELLDQSIGLTMRHPLLGVGPGNFPAATGTWRVVHNTYTEFGAEAGLPAVFLFCMILMLSFRNIRRVRKSALYRENPQVQLFASAMWASLAAYLVGAAFASTEYTLFPYYMMAYTSALYRLTIQPTPVTPAPEAKAEEFDWNRKRNGASTKSEYAWPR